MNNPNCQDEKIHKQTPNLSRVVLADLAAASLASFLVSPFICIIDKVITKKASGAQGILACTFVCVQQLVTKPISFIKSPEFRWVMFVYSSTYVAANITDSLCALYNKDPALPKLLTTAPTNMITCIAKDVAFAKMFGVIAPTYVPFQSYICFALRDVFTVGASVSMPKIIADRNYKNYSHDKVLEIAQLTLPIAIQLVTTPFHLLGLDFYNVKKRRNVQRLKWMVGQMPYLLPMQILRIAPAFSLGGIGNLRIRQYLHQAFA